MQKAMLLLIILLASPASAVLLSDYPAPFVVNGKPAHNFAIIVGYAADANDVLGAVDIMQKLQVDAAVSTAVPIGERLLVKGDAVEIGSNSDYLELLEPIGDVRPSITEVDIDMLKGGQIITQEGSTEYNQYIRFNRTAQSTPPSGAVNPDSDERNRIGIFLFWEKHTQLFEYELEFEEGLESIVEDATLPDLQDKDITILGQPFVIVDSQIKSIDANTTQASIRLMGSIVSAVLGENDEQEYSIDGKEYNVEVMVISETASNGKGAVKFRINGEITDELTDGDTDVLADGTQIGIRDILATGKDIQKSAVQFYIGSYSIDFEDFNTTDDLFQSGGTSVNLETIEESEVQIKGNFTDNQTYKISSITYRLFADAVLGDVYIPPGAGLRENLDEPEGMLTPNWDIRFAALEDTGMTLIRFDAANNIGYDFEFTNQEGIFFDSALITNENNLFKWGDADDDFWFTESTTPFVSDGDFFLVSNCNINATDDTCFSHILRYDNLDTTNDHVTFTDLGTGIRKETYDGTTGELVVGGVVYAFNVNETNGNLSIDLNGNGSITNCSTAVLATMGEGLIDFGNQSNSTNCADNSNLSAVIGTGAVGTTQVVQLVTLRKEFQEALTNEIVNITITAENDSAVSIPPNSTVGFITPFLAPTETPDFQLAFTFYGALFTIYDPGGNVAQDLTISYPMSQVFARVFITGGLTEIKPNAEEELQPIPLGAARLDDEINDISQYNAIIIGGPCANLIAAQLMPSSPCWEALPETIIKLYEHPNGNTALIAAGRTAADTRKAAQTLANGKANVEAMEFTVK